MISRVKFVTQTKTPTPPKICSTHPTMMKLGDVIPDLKRIQKITWYTFLILLTSAFFHQILQVLLSRNTYKKCILIQFYNSFVFCWFFKRCLINMIVILMMLAKLATTGLLIEVFWSKGYGVRISVHEDTNEIYHVTEIIL